ncbi:MAG: hypothetical protein SCK29_10225 [Bacillota bacterium]|nr:hypothetical protein [Bacillota bacterium]MDW7684477.1 hypothetical protein [Bacillota bacterium]
MKKHGRVLEATDKHAVLLTADGCFVRVSGDYGKLRAGQEATVTVPMDRKPLVATFMTAIAAVLILFFVLPGVVPGQGEGRELSYLAFDVNPGVEVAFVNNLEVVSFRATDIAGEELLDGIKVGMPLLDAVELLIRKSGELSYLQPDDTASLVMLTLVGADALRNDLEETVHRVLREMNVGGFVALSSAAEDTRKEALDAGLSLNRYLLVQKLRKYAGESEGEQPGSLLELFKQAGPTGNGQLQPVVTGSEGNNVPEPVDVPVEAPKTVPPAPPVQKAPVPVSPPADTNTEPPITDHGQPVDEQEVVEKWR